MRQDHRAVAHHQRFIAEPAAAQSVRRTLEMFTPELGRDLVQTLQLLVTELVGNAVTHAGREGLDMIELDLFVTPRRVRVTVTDAGPGFQPQSTSIDTTAARGRGLQLVEVMADRWGTRSDGESRVWAEIDRSPHAQRCAAQRVRARRPSRPAAGDARRR